MPRGQLGYEGQKFILQYLDPNTRFLLHQRCPAVRTTNKMAPLRISNARLTPFNLAINDTSYRLGIYISHTAELIDEVIPRLRRTYDKDEVVIENDIGGVQRNHGLDEYFADSRKSQLECDEHLLEKLPVIMEEKKKRVAEIERILPLRNLFAQNSHSVQKIIDLGKELDRLKAELTEYETNPPKGVVPLYTNYVQLTINSPKRGLIVERTNYRESLSDNEYYLLNLIFGFSKVTIKKFSIGPETTREPIRFPITSQRLDIWQLELSGKIRILLDLLKPMLLSPTMNTVVLQTITDYSHDLIKEAKLLVIAGESRPNCLLELSNTEVIRKGSRFSTTQASALIAHWRAKHHPTGRKYSVEFYEMSEVTRMMRNIEELQGAVKGEIEESRGKPFPRCVTFPMSNFTELNVYALTNWHIDSQLMRFCDRVLLYYVIFQIHPKGHATPL